MIDAASWCAARRSSPAVAELPAGDLPLFGNQAGQTRSGRRGAGGTAVLLRRNFPRDGNITGFVFQRTQVHAKRAALTFASWNFSGMRRTGTERAAFNSRAWGKSRQKIKTIRTRSSTSTRSTLPPIASEDRPSPSNNVRTPSGAVSRNSHVTRTPTTSSIACVISPLCACSRDIGSSRSKNRPNRYICLQQRTEPPAPGGLPILSATWTPAVLVLDTPRRRALRSLPCRKQMPAARSGL
jgi:hypothetical protein